MMATTQIGRASRVRAASGREPVADDGRRGGRVARRLWALLHAQGLINGTAGSPHDVAMVEDDRGRMSARRAN
jgi:hypothetical protein